MFLCSDPAPSHIHTLSLHDALPISGVMAATNQELSAAGANIESQVLATSGSLGYAVTDISGEVRSEEHTSELQSRGHLVCRLLLEKKKKIKKRHQVSMVNHKKQRPR